MNKLYASYPSNNRVRKIKLSPAKDATKTFIGGLVIGTAIGCLAMYLILANVFIKQEMPIRHDAQTYNQYPR